MRLLGLLVFLFFFHGNAQAQTLDDWSVVLQDLEAETLYARAAQNEIDTQTVEYILSLLEHPVDVNTADRDTLCTLPAFNCVIADTIVTYRKLHGPFKNLEDLLKISEMPVGIWRLTKPFLWVETHSTVTAETALLAPDFSNVESYLRAVAQYTIFQGGVALSYRPITNYAWDQRYGVMVAQQNSEPHFEHAHLQLKTKQWHILFGSYHAGFSERLTFDTTALQNPQGFYANNRMILSNTAVKSSQGLWGAALSYQQQHLTLMSFLSAAAYDVYQYDINSKGDAWSQTEETSNQFYAAENPQEPLHYLTLENAMREYLLGLHLLFEHEKTEVSFTCYAAHTVFPSPQLTFSESAKFPQRQTYGALGLSAKQAFKKLTLSTESTLLDNRAWAAITQILWEPNKRFNLQQTWRYFHPDFDNPHTGAYAAADEEQGNKARNEKGVNTTLTTQPWENIKTFFTADLWQQASFKEQPLKTKVGQQIAWLLSPHERFITFIKYENPNGSSWRVGGEFNSKRLLTMSLRIWRTWQKDPLSHLGLRFFIAWHPTAKTQTMTVVKYEDKQWQWYVNLSQTVQTHWNLRARYEMNTQETKAPKHFARLLLETYW